MVYKSQFLPISIAIMQWSKVVSPCHGTDEFVDSASSPLVAQASGLVVSPQPLCLVGMGLIPIQAGRVFDGVLLKPC